MKLNRIEDINNNKMKSDRLTGDLFTSFCPFQCHLDVCKSNCFSLDFFVVVFRFVFFHRRHYQLLLSSHDINRKKKVINNSHFQHDNRRDATLNCLLVAVVVALMELLLRRLFKYLIARRAFFAPVKLWLMASLRPFFFFLFGSVCFCSVFLLFFLTAMAWCLSTAAVIRDYAIIVHMKPNHGLCPRFVTTIVAAAADAASSMSPFRFIPIRMFCGK